MNVFNLSYTRSCRFQHRRNGTLLPFTGSSLCRTKPKKQTSENVKEAKESISKQTAQSLLQQEVDILRINKDGESGNEKKVRLRVNSRRTKSKITNKCFAFTKRYGFKRVPFLTLTFVSSVSDKVAVCILNKFLTMLRRKNAGVNFIWVAERQKNGNIHFHMLLSMPIDLPYFNALWVLQQYNSGVHHPKYSIIEIKQRYKQGTIKEILNPLDVRYANNIEAVTAYLTKYITKNNDEFDCQTWNCSKGVSRYFTTALIDKELYSETTDKSKNYMVSRKTKKRYEVETFKTDYCHINSIYNKEYFHKKMAFLAIINEWVCNDFKKELRPEFLHSDFEHLYNLNLN